MGQKERSRERGAHVQRRNQEVRIWPCGSLPVVLGARICGIAEHQAAGDLGETESLDSRRRITDLEGEGGSTKIYLHV